MKMSYFEKHNFHVIKQSLGLISKKGRRKYFFVVIAQMLLGLLDLVGVSLMGLFGTLAISGIESKAPSGRTAQFLSVLGMGNIKFQNQAAILALLITTVFVAKTLISIYLTRKILHFLSSKGAEISSNLLAKQFNQQSKEIHVISTQELIYSLTAGVTGVMVGILGSFASILTDTTLLVLVLGGLFIVDPAMAASSILLFGILGIILNFTTRKKALNLGKKNSSLIVQSNEKISEYVKAYKEIYIRNRRFHYSQKISKIRYQLASTTAEIAFLPFISKYVIESSVILCAFGLGAFQFATQDSIKAISVLSVFLAAITRITPALLRLQQSAVTIKASSGVSGPTLELAEKLSKVNALEDRKYTVTENSEKFLGSVLVRDVSFAYSDDSEVIKGISLSVAPGEFCALVGPSGAGKSTLIDLIIGVQTPTTGTILVSGKDPQSAIELWPGSVGFVPQDVEIIQGSVLENICLGYDPNEFDIQAAENALRMANLSEYVSSLPNGIHETLGDGRVRMSGGQKQRLGIARALYTTPKLIIFDEATSALDSESEEKIAQVIKSLHGEVTVLVVAHRLSTVRTADNVVYIDGGKISGQGSFDQLKKSLPAFDVQAKLMGL